MTLVSTFIERYTYCIRKWVFDKLLSFFSQMKRLHSRFRACVLRSLEMCVVRQLNSASYGLRFSRSVSFLTILIISTLLVPGDVCVLFCSRWARVGLVLRMSQTMVESFCRILICRKTRKKIHSFFYAQCLEQILLLLWTPIVKNWRS